ncbi:MAG: MarR family transcriptional regulator [Anaerolineae bacterium]|nr:MarR family transcriptional regulator [Anaerolineae bacterium]
MQNDNGQQKSETILFEAVSELGKLLGLNKSASLALANLFIAEEPQSLDAIADRTGIAKSSNSVILKQLNQMGLVDVVSQPHDRRKYYKIVKNPGDRIAILIAQRLDNLTSRQHELFELENHCQPTPYQERVEQLKRIYHSLANAAQFLRTERDHAWEVFDERLAVDQTIAPPNNSATRR